MQVTIETPYLTRALADMAIWPKEHLAAKVHAGNRVAASAHSQVVRAVAKETGTLARRVRRQSNLRRARWTGKDYPRIWFGTQNRPLASPGKRPTDPVPNPPLFRATMPSGARGWFYRHPTRKMRGSATRAAVVGMRVDLGPAVERHLGPTARRVWSEKYAELYEKDFLRRVDRRLARGR